MKTSFKTTKTIERFLLGKLSPPDMLLFKARLLTDPVLRLHLVMQQKTYQIIRLFSRQDMKARLEQTHQKLFRDPEKLSFSKTIHSLFVKP